MGSFRGSEFLGEQCKQGKVLLISSDESKGSTSSRLLQRGFDLLANPQNLRIALDFELDNLDWLRNQLEEFRPDLIIFDSLTSISRNLGISENSAELAMCIYNLKDLLADFQCSGVIIHHHNKDKNSQGISKVSGSLRITASVYGIWQLIEAGGDNLRHLQITCRESASSIHNLSLNEWDNWTEQGIFKYLGEPNFSLEDKSQGDLVVELLKKYPMGLESVEIEHHLPGIKAIKQVLYRLVNKGLLSKKRSVNNPKRFNYLIPQVNTVNQVVNSSVNLANSSQNKGSENKVNKVNTPTEVVNPEIVNNQENKVNTPTEVVNLKTESIDIQGIDKVNNKVNNKVNTTFVLSNNETEVKTEDCTNTKLDQIKLENENSPLDQQLDDLTIYKEYLLSCETKTDLTEMIEMVKKDLGDNYPLAKKMIWEMMSPEDRVRINKLLG